MLPERCGTGMKALGKGSIASIMRIGLLIAWWALWVAAGIWVLVSIGYAVTLALIANGVIDPASLVPPEGSVRISFDLQSGIGVDYGDPNSAPWQVVVPSLLIFGVGIAGSLVIVWRLRKLFDSFTSGEPFRRENALHLRAIWIAMVAIELTRYALMALTTLLLFQFRDPTLRSISIGLDDQRLSTWGSILILIVLAEVFREGARLKEEQELTI